MSDLQEPTNENVGVQPDEFCATSTKHKKDDSWNTNTAQCARALERLRDGPATTYELSRRHDIYYPPARVLQLRKQGHDIATVWERVLTEAGVWHRVGKYCLIKEAA